MAAMLSDPATAVREQIAAEGARTRGVYLSLQTLFDQYLSGLWGVKVVDHVHCGPITANLKRTVGANPSRRGKSQGPGTLPPGLTLGQ